MTVDIRLDLVGATELLTAYAVALGRLYNLAGRTTLAEARATDLVGPSPSTAAAPLRLAAESVQRSRHDFAWRYEWVAAEFGRGVTGVVHTHIPVRDPALAGSTIADLIAAVASGTPAQRYAALVELVARSAVNPGIAGMVVDRLGSAIVRDVLADARAAIAGPGRGLAARTTTPVDPADDADPMAIVAALARLLGAASRSPSGRGVLDDLIDTADDPARVADLILVVAVGRFDPAFLAAAVSAVVHSDDATLTLAATWLPGPNGDPGGITDPITVALAALADNPAAARIFFADPTAVAALDGPRPLDTVVRIDGRWVYLGDPDALFAARNRARAAALRAGLDHPDGADAPVSWVAAVIHAVGQLGWTSAADARAIGDFVVAHWAALTGSAISPAAVAAAIAVVGAHAAPFDALLGALGAKAAADFLAALTALVDGGVDADALLALAPVLNRIDRMLAAIVSAIDQLGGVPADLSTVQAITSFITRALFVVLSAAAPPASAAAKAALSLASGAASAIVKQLFRSVDGGPPAENPTVNSLFRALFGAPIESPDDGVALPNPFQVDLVDQLLAAHPDWIDDLPAPPGTAMVRGGRIVVPPADAPLADRQAFAQWWQVAVGPTTRLGQAFAAIMRQFLVSG